MKAEHSRITLSVSQQKNVLIAAKLNTKITDLKTAIIMLLMKDPRKSVVLSNPITAIAPIIMISMFVTFRAISGLEMLLNFSMT